MDYRNRSYLAEGGPGGSGWKQVGHGGHAGSMIERAVGPYTKQIALAFFKMLNPRLYVESISKIYFGYGHAALIGEGMNSSDLTLKWDFHVERSDADLFLRVSFRAADMARDGSQSGTVSSGSDPMPVMKRLADAFNRFL